LKNEQRSRENKFSEGELTRIEGESTMAKKPAKSASKKKSKSAKKKK
jgi:hypothetical protein